jgi:hypothetical protein
MVSRLYIEVIADGVDLDRASFQSDADLYFIDGEHTDAAVVADFEFLSWCLRAERDDSCS